MEFFGIDINILWLVGILIFSIIIHELAHGYAALWQGDDTAEQAGRLTLNPIPHIDLIGSIIIPAAFILSGSNFFLGWAKPVPYNPNNLRNQKWGEAMVAAAGPLSNFILAGIILIASFLLFSANLINQDTLNLLHMAIFINIFLAVLNLIPIAPLDGSKILYSLLPYGLSLSVRHFMEKYQIFLFLALIFFLLTTDILINIVMFIHVFLVGLF